jgi:hypothetical protein
MMESFMMKNWLIFPYVFIFFQPHYLRPHPMDAMQVGLEPVRFRGALNVGRISRSISRTGVRHTAQG